MAAHFALPLIEENADGWGPVSVPEKFKEVPYYAPFNKGDKVGKAADWQQQQHQGRGSSMFCFSNFKRKISKKERTTK